MTTKNPIAEIALQYFADGAEHTELSLASFLASGEDDPATLIGEYMGVDGFTAYQVIAHDVIGILAEQKKIRKCRSGLEGTYILRY